MKATSIEKHLRLTTSELGARRYIVFPDVLSALADALTMNYSLEIPAEHHRSRAGVCKNT